MFTEMNTSGAGLVDAIAELAGSIGDENSNGLDGVLGIGNVLIEGLGVIANPLDALATSAISWIIDHVAILRWPLDITIGDPRVVTSTVTTLNDTALALDRLASEQNSSIAREVPTYLEGDTQSSIAFSNHMRFRAAQLSGASLACAGAAQAIAMGGTRIAAVRSAIRDLIAEYVWNLLELAAKRLPMGFLTAGAAVADFCARALSWAATLIDKIGGMLRKLLDALADIGKQVKQIAEMVSKLVSPTSAAKHWRPGLGLVPRTAMSWSTEAAKVDSTERATADKSAAGQERVGHMHAEEDERQEDPPLGPTREPDWWTRKGNLY
ncbi:hypothetical protein [Actinophytocola glycyrrhizae]|uniref:Uncharacterized protein n=1 Tax=Actinophytocola glycyrrhizae TaxID=2044873 RepID=A0ABV9SCT0_9PSEU